MHDPDTTDGRRRRFFKVLGAASITASLPACSDRPAADVARPTAYRPTFFDDAEWAFVNAFVDHLIPADDVGPGAVESGVPEFIDRHMQTPYAAGDIWYMQGPFVEASPLFGYQGRLPPKDIVRVGIRAFDAYCRAHFGGRTFAQLAPEQREGLCKDAFANKLAFADIGSKVFFDTLLTETRTGYFADPKYGGNRDMKAWVAVGYPGVRADYLDWVGVRDRPYPLPPVDLAGRRA